MSCAKKWPLFLGLNTLKDRDGTRRYILGVVVEHNDHRACYILWVIYAYKLNLWHRIGIYWCLPHEYISSEPHIKLFVASLRVTYILAMKTSDLKAFPSPILCFFFCCGVCRIALQPAKSKAYRFDFVIFHRRTHSSNCLYYLQWLAVNWGVLKWNYHWLISCWISQYINLVIR